MTKESILIVEDEELVARVLCRALGLPQSGDYHVEVYGSSEEALKRLDEAHFDLLISDLRLPGMDGLELIKRVRKLSPETRSILVTGFGSPQIEEQVNLLNAVYILKPFHLGDIVQAVQQLLREPAKQAT